MKGVFIHMQKKQYCWMGLSDACDSCSQSTVLTHQTFTGPNNQWREKYLQFFFFFFFLMWSADTWSMDSNLLFKSLREPSYCPLQEHSSTFPCGKVYYTLNTSNCICLCLGSYIKGLSYRYFSTILKIHALSLIIFPSNW